MTKTQNKNLGFLKKSLQSVRRFTLGWVVPPQFAEMLRQIRNHTLAFLEAGMKRDPLRKFQIRDLSLWRDSLTHAESYLEFGSGGSTEYVAREHECSIRAVETSIKWATEVQSRLENRADVVHIDLGETGDWGRPLTYARRREFVSYCEAGFLDGYQPDTILIDGRFRVACFLTCLMRANPGTKIVFDDWYRQKYHVVEEILLPAAKNRRQALFEIPQGLNFARVERLRRQFLMVMD